MEMGKSLLFGNWFTVKSEVHALGGHEVYILHWAKCFEADIPKDFLQVYQHRRAQQQAVEIKFDEKDPLFGLFLCLEGTDNAYLVHYDELDLSNVDLRWEASVMEQKVDFLGLVDWVFQELKTRYFEKRKDKEQYSLLFLANDMALDPDFWPSGGMLGIRDNVEDLLIHKCLDNKEFYDTFKAVMQAVDAISKEMHKDGVIPGKDKTVN